MTHCKHWAVWSYQVPLKKPLAVLGYNSQTRQGWIIGRYNKTTSKWEYGEVSPLYSFHNTDYKSIYDDIINSVRYNKKPQTALVKNIFDVWDTPVQSGTLQINSLLSTPAHPIQSPPLTVKIKLGRQSFEKDIEYFSRLQQMHPTTKWRLDCNRQWTPAQLRSFWSHCNQDHIEYIEDPLTDPRLLETIQDIPIALDESLMEFQNLLALPHVVAAIIKPTLHMNWQSIVEKYPTVHCILSSTFEGSLGIWGLGQLALSHRPNQVHGLGTLSWFQEEIVQQPLQYTDSTLTIPARAPQPIFSRLKWEDGQ